MAYRRRQGQGPLKPFIFEEESRNPISPPPSVPFDESSTTTSSTSLAAKATRASSAQRDSSLSSAYSQAALSSSSHAGSSPSSLEDTNPYEFTSMRSLNESKHGFWGSLARKAKAVLDDDSAESTRQRVDTATEIEYPNSNLTSSHYKSDSPIIQKRLNAFASSLNSIGGAIGNALEEGLTIVENRTADIIQETRKLHIRRKGSGFETRNQVQNVHNARQQQSRQTQLQPQMQTDQDIQLKASRDVAMAMAAKAKLLLRELKTTKADLAFAKERCAQLEEENRLLRENREKGNNLEDDDMIRLQLETLLAEKARLAQENSVYSRENRFLREIVEYHQLTMQDVVYLDEGTEEVTEVYPLKVPSAISLPSIATTPPHPAFRPDGAPHNISLQVSQHIPLVPMPPSEFREVPQSAALRSS